MEKGQKLRVKIEDMTAEGQGLGKSSDGLAIFVKDGILGEELEVELTKVKKNYAFATIVSRICESPWARESYCEYSSRCGGCTYSGLSYEGQLQLKSKQVKDKLQRLGGLIDPVINEIIGAEEIFRYRNKATLPISTGGIITKKGGVVSNAGPLAIGFNKAKSHDVVDCYDCKIQSEPAMAAAEALRQFMKEDNITAFDPKWEKGLMRHIVVKTANTTGQVMVILVINGKGIPNQEKLVEMLDDAIYNLEPREDGSCYELASVVINIKKHNTPEILGTECLTIAGKPVIEEYVGNLKFEISPLSFYQINPVQMEALYNVAMQYANLKGNETILDVYCGVGTIGLYAAKHMEHLYKEIHGTLDYDKLGYIYGIESVKGAVIDANRNAAVNGIVNARYVCGKAEEVLPEMVGFDDPVTTDIRINKADVVFLDPPRSGCYESVLDAVVSANPDRIVYVSCDPATLARDVKYLGQHGYEFVEATPVDMFPNTKHVETCVLLSHKNSQASPPSL